MKVAFFCQVNASKVFPEYENQQNNKPTSRYRYGKSHPKILFRKFWSIFSQTITDNNPACLLVARHHLENSLAKIEKHDNNSLLLDP